jgi:hypothetical protein
VARTPGCRAELMSAHTTAVGGLQTTSVWLPVSVDSFTVTRPIAVVPTPNRPLSLMVDPLVRKGR